MSVQGYRHAQQGMPCQDAWGTTHTGPPRSRITVLAVADGAGSRPRSQEGAQLAIQLATSVYGARLAEWDRAPRNAEDLRGQLQDAFLEVLDAFLADTRALSGDRSGSSAGRDGPADFATTLTVVVLGTGWLGCTSLGDGFVVLRAGEEDGEPQFHLLPQPESAGEYGNETTFLSSADAALRVGIACVRDDGVDGVVVSTDGLAQAALSGGQGPVLSVNRSFAASVLRSLDRPGPDPRSDARELRALLLSDRLTALNADDKTLVRAVRTTDGPGFGGELP
ncbi:protein phosphatase 2C domain-containing protein [Streptomyces sp. 5-8]|uniref:Protein phosphatase 2C domain-containing protein n=1 Tax=Streptomyces musisoli TaxID=2802280 RepID=A0ABS1P2N0_9ACTN|nr:MULTISPECIES: PP2C family serine/threonine-protein phosphatase [Streptomyces]MBL1106625.1 protein phosphatase 2C domain-containing protein [Streptomyces musisoli]MBY8840579.1 protein phosphatase 2C domain-containing protein [Streptomyces sp. SP2-10]